MTADARIWLAGQVAQDLPQSDCTVPEADGYQPFPADVLPFAISEFVTEAAEAVGVDASFVALPMLATLAAAIGNTRRIEVKADWCEPCVLWAGIVGDSGTMKSPALNLATAPAIERQTKAMQAYRAAVAGHKSELSEYKRAMKAWLRDGQAAGESEPVEPAAPVPERSVVSDVTVEGLVSRLQSAPRGLLLTRDELSGFLGSFGQYKGGKGSDESAYLSMYNAAPVLVDRKNPEQPMLFVPRANVSITGGIQPGILRRDFTAQHQESGLAARFVLVMPPKRAKFWTERVVRDVTQRRIRDVYDRLWSLEPRANRDGDPYPVDIALSCEAKAVFAAFVDEHGRETASLSGPLAAVWSKLEGLAARLALIIECAAWAGNHISSEGGPAEISEQAIRGGIALARWAGQEATRIYAMLSEDKGETEVRELTELIRRIGGSVTVRGIQRAGRFKTAEAARTALNRLAVAGKGRWIENRSGGQGGRPTLTFKLV